MALELAEAAISTIKDYFEANLGTYLDVIDARQGDFTLDDPVSYLWAELPEVGQLPVAIFVAEGTAQVKEFYSSVDSRTAISILFVVRDQDMETLRKRIYRYGEASLQMCRDARDLPEPAKYIIEWVDTEYSYPEAGPTGEFIQGVRTRISMGKIENE